MYIFCTYIETKYSHLDARSFHLHGEYKSEDNQEKSTERIKERPIIITKGYSRDHRPDLKQCVLDLITSSDGDIPLFMRVGDGNEADKAAFGKILLEFKNQINFDSIMVCDSALYSQKNLKLIENLKWISRVPMTLKKAKELVLLEIEESEIDPEERKRRAQLNLEGYKWKSKIVKYAGIKQTWLIVESEKRKASDLSKLEKKIKTEKAQVEKLLKELKKEEFEHPEQARYQIRDINKKRHFFAIQEVQVIASQSKDKKTSKAQKTIDKISGVSQSKVEEIAKQKKEAGRLILATNLVDEEKIKPEEILSNYKNQQSCERGFRFLKDP